MRQLGQLQSHYDEIKDMDTEIVAVFREDEKGAEGLKTAREKCRATFPFVMDLGAEHTTAYSHDKFSTYVIAQDGTIKSELSGTKMLRPSADDILAKVKEAVAPSE